MFGILSERLASFLLENGLVFLLENGLVNTSVQKAGVTGSPGCLEHSSMIWHTIQEAKEAEERFKYSLA